MDGKAKQLRSKWVTAKFILMRTTSRHDIGSTKLDLSALRVTTSHEEVLERDANDDSETMKRLTCIALNSSTDQFLSKSAILGQLHKRWIQTRQLLLAYRLIVTRASSHMIVLNDSEEDCMRERRVRRFGEAFAIELSGPLVTVVTVVTAR